MEAPANPAVTTTLQWTSEQVLQTAGLLILNAATCAPIKTTDCGDECKKPRLLIIQTRPLMQSIRKTLTMLTRIMVIHRLTKFWSPLVSYLVSCSFIILLLIVFFVATSRHRREKAKRNGQDLGATVKGKDHMKGVRVDSELIPIKHYREWMTKKSTSTTKYIYLLNHCHHL